LYVEPEVFTKGSGGRAGGVQLHTKRAKHESEYLQVRNHIFVEGLLDEGQRGVRGALFGERKQLDHFPGELLGRGRLRREGREGGAHVLDALPQAIFEQGGLILYPISKAVPGPTAKSPDTNKDGIEDGATSDGKTVEGLFDKATHVHTDKPAPDGDEDD